ncbi:ABC transporter substrate-binding protein [Algihabitans albus]|uniref:ABC transporter substrate-binding protein n=1 Tax=Algihabitans albus TaxID=2164067 RepID=UPI000E5D5F07|nr:ABC transporter substrate-binding protein [Algihabitans albus]
MSSDLYWKRELERVHPALPSLQSQVARGEVSRREFLRSATLLGLGATAAYAMTGLPRPASAAARSAEAKAGGTLRVAMRVREIADPALLNSVTQSNQARHILEYLTKTGTDNVTRPYLAENWSTSEDLKTWTFNLRRGVRWSNGDAFTAEDVAFNVRRWLNPEIGSANIGLFSAMTEEVRTGGTDESGKPLTRTGMTEGAIEVLDEHTIRFHLNRAELALPENFYNYGCCLAHRGLEEMGGNLAAAPVGTGPFELVELAPSAKQVMRRRDDYWGQAPLLEEVHYIDVGDDPAATLSALVSDQVDLSYENDVNQLEILERQSSLQIFEALTAQTGVARMQMTQAPFDDRRVRQAVTACMDHEALLRIALRGRGAPAENHHVCPIHPEYYQLPPLKQDHDRARALLAEAGHGDGLRVSIDVASSTGQWELNAVLALKQQLAPAGIVLEPNPLPAAKFWDVWLKTPFGFTPWTHRPLGVMVLNLAYRSGVPWNESKYSNPDFDAALTEASGLLDPTARRSAMEQVQRILQEDAVIAQPLWRSVLSAGNRRVQGYEMHPTQYHDFGDTWLS